MLGANQQSAAVVLDAAHHAEQLLNSLDASHAMDTSPVSGTYQSPGGAFPKLAHTVLYRSPSTHGYTLNPNLNPFT
jgi:hypothetical protein